MRLTTSFDVGHGNVPFWNSATFTPSCVRRLSRRLLRGRGASTTIDEANGGCLRPLRKPRVSQRVMVYEMNPPTRRKRTRHSLETPSARGDSVADTHLRKIYQVRSTMGSRIDISHIRVLANSSPTYRPFLRKQCS